MKILYLHQHFVSSTGVGATRSHDIAKNLVKNGHQVTMVCGYSPTKGLPKVRPFRLWRVYWLDGIKIIICNIPYSQKMSSKMRLVSFILFALVATIVSLFERRIDLVFATSTPLTITIPGVIISKIKKKPYVFEARDLWPEDHVASGRMKEGSLIHKFFSYLEKISYKNAQYINVVSQGFYNRLVVRGIPEEKLTMIPLGADGDKFMNPVPNKEIFEKIGIENKKIAIYTGAHGDTNGLFQVLDAAEELKDRKDIAIVFIGKGAEKDKLKNQAIQRNLDNVYFLDPVPITKLVGVLAASHIGLIIFKQISRPRWLTPNKFYDYAFIGIPSVVNFAGTTADLVTREGIGIAAKPGDSKSLAEAIMFYADNEDERIKIGEKARDFAYKNFDRKIISLNMEELFIKARNKYGKNS